MKPYVTPPWQRPEVAVWYFFLPEAAESNVSLAVPRFDSRHLSATDADKKRNNLVNLHKESLPWTVILGATSMFHHIRPKYATMKYSFPSLRPMRARRRTPLMERPFSTTSLSRADAKQRDPQCHVRDKVQGKAQSNSIGRTKLQGKHKAMEDARKDQVPDGTNNEHGFFGSLKSLFTMEKLQRQKDIEKREQRENSSNPYIQYPLVTKEQMRRLTTDAYKFDFAYASYAHHSSNSDPAIHSLSDLTDPTQLNSLLPRRRPHGSPSDTLSIKAGDDAMLVSPTVMAIADGVSGWESKGEQCSSGIWSRSMLETLSRLMTEYKLSHAPHSLNSRDVDEILDDSFLHTSHLMDLQGLKGSSTLILGMVVGECLKYISIGDSKLYVIRDGEIIKENQELMVDHLCPQQIGTQTLNSLPSEMAIVGEVLLQPDDLVVMCLDGISDNLFSWEITQTLEKSLNAKKDNVRSLPNKLLTKCKEVAFDDNAYTPYNEKVNLLPTERAGHVLNLGGKLDDMSLCIARVVENKRAPTTA